MVVLAAILVSTTVDTIGATTEEATIAMTTGSTTDHTGDLLLMSNSAASLETLFSVHAILVFCSFVFYSEADKSGHTKNKNVFVSEGDLRHHTTEELTDLDPDLGLILPVSLFL